MLEKYGVFIKMPKSEKELMEKRNAAKEPPSFRMIPISGGEFLMGNNNTGLVTRKISSFYMSNVLVTQKIFKNAMGRNPSKLKSDNRPVECVSWFEAIIFCNRFSEINKRTKCYSVANKSDLETLRPDNPAWLTLKCDFSANGFRLPTEAEWEYAAHAGTNFIYSGSDNIDDVAWYGENSDIQSHDVGTKKPNAFGIFDMSGNIDEWCWDWFDKYDQAKLADPRGAVYGTMRVKRGGGWLDDAVQCEVTSRSCSAPSGKGSTLGFRVCSSCN